MYNKVKELSREGLSIRQISRNTGLDRVTVRKYLRMTEEEFSDFLAQQKQRYRKLHPYEQFIKNRVMQERMFSRKVLRKKILFKL